MLSLPVAPQSVPAIQLPPTFSGPAPYVVRLVSLILGSGHISLSGSDSRGSLCFFDTVLESESLVLGSGIKMFLSLVQVSNPRWCVSHTGSGFRVSVLSDWLVSYSSFTFYPTFPFLFVNK